MIGAHLYGYESWEQMAISEKQRADRAVHAMEVAKGKGEVAIAKLQTLVVMLEQQGVVSPRDSREIFGELVNFF